jgi:hypothetical protein
VLPRRGTVLWGFSQGSTEITVHYGANQRGSDPEPRSCPLVEEPKPPRLLQVLAKWGYGAAPDSPAPDGIAEMGKERSLIDRGLPKPVRQHEVWTDGSFVARLDLAWPAARLGLELLRSCAGTARPRSSTPIASASELLRSCGWDIVEVTPKMAQEDGDLSLCSILSAALRRTGHRDPSTDPTASARRAR